jgi:hypothetical protein
MLKLAAPLLVVGGAGEMRDRIVKMYVRKVGLMRRMVPRANETYYLSSPATDQICNISTNAGRNH